MSDSRLSPLSVSAHDCYWRQQLTDQITLTTSAQHSLPLFVDANRSWTGADLLARFRDVRQELGPLAPIGSKVAICSADPLLQACLILAVIYSQRVPVVFASGGHEDLHEAQVRMGIAAVLEQSDLDWHVLPNAPALVFNAEGEVAKRRPGRKWRALAVPG